MCPLVIHNTQKGTLQMTLIKTPSKKYSIEWNYRNTICFLVLKDYICTQINL